MKKTLSIFTILMFVFSTLAIASPPVPAQVRGYFYINESSTNGYIVQVENIRTGGKISGATIPSLVTEPGGFAFDLSDLPGGYIVANDIYAGDVIKVKIIKTPLGQTFSHPQGEVSFNADGLSYKEIRIEIDDEDVEQPITYQCYDGSFVSNQNDCPVPPEPEVEEENRATASENKLSASVDVLYGQVINIKLDNNKISKLLDETVYFDGENLDVKEEVYFSGVVKTSIDNEDYGLVPRLVIQEGAIEYNFIFEDTFELSEINEDDPLEITFLGKELKIIEASESSIKLRTGEEYYLQQGEIVQIEEKEVTVETIGEDSILILVSGESRIISEGQDKEVNGLRIHVDELLYRSYEGSESRVNLIIGTKSDETVNDGDDFELFIEDDEEYTWLIDLSATEPYIGIVNQEAYVSVDEDDDFHPVALGETFYLPNVYLKINFKSTTDVEMNEVNFRVKDGELLVKGDFTFGAKDYEKVYVKYDGIYDDDNDLITVDKVEIGDSDIYLEKGSAKIENLVIELDMSDITYAGVSYKDEELDYLDHLGIIFKNPENAVDDQSGFEVLVPEDRPEALIIFGELTDEEKEEAKEEEEKVTEPESTPETLDEEEEEETDVVVPTPEPEVIEKKYCYDGTLAPDNNLEECPAVPVEEPESKVFNLLTTLLVALLAALGIKWRYGFIGLAKYQWNKGNKLTAVKMLLTATKRAKDDYYSNKKK